MNLPLRTTRSVEDLTPVTAAAVPGAGSSARDAEVDAGTHLDRYVVLENAGRGGMGHVLRAYDPALQREVALKLVNAESITRSTRDRVTREARAMARLSHPNVVVVHDVRETAGGITLVMEYVRGTTLRAWVRARPREPAEIIERFVGAGRGLEAAHGAGLLHRDFKPANVLVGPPGVVKVTDFGLASHCSDADRSSDDAVFVARAEPSTSDALLQTRSVVGTPRYMAPEQMRGAPLSAAADQYAFCVALWEALCGEAPFAGRRFGSLARAKERGMPAWPTGAPPLPREAIEALRRGLSPQASDRWPNMGTLLTALDSRPRQRNRRIRFGAAALGVLVLGGLASYAIGLSDGSTCSDGRSQLGGIWDEEQRDTARQRMQGTGLSFASRSWERSDQLLTGYAESWATLHDQTCAGAERNALSDRSVALRFDCLARAKQHLSAVAEVLAQADARVVVEAHALAARLPPIARCTEEDALLAGAVLSHAPPGEDLVFERVRSQLAKADAAIDGGLFELAARELATARNAADDAGSPQLHLEVATSEARLLEGRQELEQAELAYRTVLRRAALLGNLPVIQTAAVRLMVIVGFEQARPDEGLRYRELAEGLAAGQPEREVGVYNALGLIDRGRGHFMEAVAYSRRAVALEEQVSGAASVNTARLRGHVAMNLQSHNQIDAAAAEFEVALPIIEQALGPEHPSVLGMRNNLATLQLEKGDFAGAEASLERLVEPFAAVYGPNHRHVASVHGNLGKALLLQQRHADAMPHLRKTLAILEDGLHADHPDIATARHDLGWASMGLGSHDTAEAEFVEALRIRFQTLPAGHAEIASVQSSLAASLLAQDRVEEARAAAEQAWSALEGGESSAPTRLDAALVLARTIVVADTSVKGRARAISLARVAHTLASESDFTAPRLPEIDALLRELGAFAAAHVARSEQHVQQVHQ